MRINEPSGFTFITNHPYSGWVAFGIVLIGFAVFIAWHFKRECDVAKSVMATVRQVDSEERASLLINHPAVSSIPRSKLTEDFVFSDLVSCEDTWDGETESTFLQASQRIPVIAKLPQRYARI